MGYERDEVSANHVDRVPSGYEIDAVAADSGLIDPESRRFGAGLSVT
jgi:hypothetical protein